MNILFVCNYGQTRSPAFARWVCENTKHTAKFVGTDTDEVNRIVFSKFDKIYTMEMHQAKKLIELGANPKLIRVLGIYEVDENLICKLAKIEGWI